MSKSKRDETEPQLNFPQPDMLFFSITNGQGGWRKSILTVKDGKVVSISSSEPDMMRIIVDSYKKDFVEYWNGSRSEGVKACIEKLKS